MPESVLAPRGRSQKKLFNSAYGICLALKKHCRDNSHLRHRFIRELKARGIELALFDMNTIVGIIHSHKEQYGTQVDSDTDTEILLETIDGKLDEVLLRLDAKEGLWSEPTGEYTNSKHPLHGVPCYDE